MKLIFHLKIAQLCVNNMDKGKFLAEEILLVNFIKVPNYVDILKSPDIWIADAVAAISTPVIGVHISNIYQREKERHTDLLAGACKACLFGFGLEGYSLAIDFIKSELNEQ